MTHRLSLRLAGALLGTALAAGAMAQPTTRDGEPTPTSPGQVLTDAAPLPAEERDSMGAIVLEDSMVRAQRANAFQAAGQRTGITSIGRNVMRVLEQNTNDADVAAREADPGIDTRRMGAPGLSPPAR